MTTTTDKEQAKIEAEQRAEQTLDAIIKKINDKATEEDSKPSSNLSISDLVDRLADGSTLTAQWIRSQIGLIVLVVAATFVYVAFRYQCQQDMIKINKLESQLRVTRYKTLSTSSALTERCRESRILEMLKQQHDSLLKASERPPYIINIEE